MKAPPRATREERMDSLTDAAELAATLRDVRTFNRLFGGHAPLIKLLGPMIKPGLKVLDVGAGAGDVGRELTRWAERRGAQIRLTGMDLSLASLRLWPNGARVAGDAARLPFKDGAFDVAVSSLTFHHLPDNVAIAALREMGRVAGAVVVSDLERSRPAAHLAAGVTRALGMHEVTRHDAPLSVMKARTPSEYRALLDAAGILDAEVRRHPFWRVTLSWGLTS